MPPDEKAPPAAPPTESPRKPLRPLPVFLALLAIAGAVFTITVLNRDSDPISGEGHNSTTQIDATQTSSSDSDMITRFHVLDALRLKAYEERDPSLIPLFVAEGSPLEPLARREIRRIERAGVFVQTKTKMLSLRTVALDPNEAKVLQVLRQSVSFIDEDGEDVTTNRGPVINRIEWTLVKQDGEWLLFDSRTL